MVRAILSNPIVYRLQQSLAWSGKKNFNALLIHVVQEMTARLGRPINVLDIGCGDGKLAARLGSCCRYTGVDMSEKYIAHARVAYGSYGTFQVADLGDASCYRMFDNARPDLILMVGVIHHCDDAAILRVLDRLSESLPNAAFISIDGVYVLNQHPIARLLLNLDRGRFIRTLDGYRRLLPTHDYLLDNFLRVPFNMVVFYKNVPLKDYAASLFAPERMAGQPPARVLPKAESKWRGRREGNRNT